MLLAICLQASDLLVSEVMSNPQGSEYENEFIEVYNASNHVIHINGWVLSDGNGVDTIAEWVGPTGIGAGKFGLILDPGYNFTEGPYAEYLNDSLAIFTISTDASLGSGGLANSAESVVIYDPDSLNVTSMHWITATDNGYSWERSQMDGADSTAIWRQSLVLNGTPGTQNSVTPPAQNIALGSLLLETAQLGLPLELIARVLNSGTESIQTFQLHVYEDQDQNDFQDASDWTKTYTFYNNIEPEAFLDVSLTLPVLLSGVHLYTVRAMLIGDQNPLDDLGSIQCSGAYPDEALTVNEIMYSPDPDQGGEWIEVWNHLNEPLSLQQWSLSDANETRRIICDSLLWIPSDALFILASSSAVIEYFSLSSAAVVILDSWPTLNASSDSVRLFDAAGHQVTSSYYRGSWGETGRSLERRHPTLLPQSSDNWQPSLDPDGASPLRENTRQLHGIELRIEEIRQGWNDLIGPTTTEMLITFSNQGLNTITDLHFQAGSPLDWSGDLQSFQVDSMELSYPDVPAGVSSQSLLILFDDSLLVDTSFTMILGFPPEQIAFNEIHYLPTEEQTEFIELVNVSDQIINFEAWSLMDKSGTLGSIPEVVWIDPNGYFLLCQDSSRLRDWCPPDVQIIELEPWPSLNNTNDSLFLMDPLQTRHLAQAYDTDQGGALGISLERRALWKDPDLADNWASSVDPSGISPGRVNSVVLPLENLILAGIEIPDSLTFVDQPFLLTGRVLNSGLSVVDHVTLQVSMFQEHQELSQTTHSLYQIAPEESLSFDVELTSPVCGWVTIQVEFIDIHDGNQEDDHLSAVVYVGCTSPPLVISEIMAIPATDEAEWLELYNRSSHSLDLKGWQISDESSSPLLIADSSFTLQPNAYLLLANSTGSIPPGVEQERVMILGLPTFNNTSDGCRLWDPQGQLMDAMFYGTLIQPISGRSLERIRLTGPGELESNWGLCINSEGSTAGRMNSLNLIQLPDQLSVQLSPNPFSPDGDGFDDELIICYELPFEQGSMTIWIFDMAGRRIAEPVQAQAVSHRGELRWDGLLNYGGTAMKGLYIIKLLVDDFHGKVWSELQKIYIN